MTLDDLRSSRSAAVTVTDTARLLDVDERTVRRAAEDGQLPAVRVGRRVLIVRERLLAMLTTDEGPRECSEDPLSRGGTTA